MKLTPADATNRLSGHNHGVLCTVHAERGVDAVPVVYAVAGELLGIPVDRVKAKSSTRLQREGNLEADPRATLLIEHWDGDDWSKLWWVRAELRWQHDPARDAAVQLADHLGRRYSQYRDHPFERILVFHLTAVHGWSAGE